MKVTVELPDSLHRDLKHQAAEQGVPMRVLVEHGIRIALSSDAPPKKKFRLKTITTKGHGLACKDNWTTIRSLIYSDCGH
ncbi:MAG: hypothetical protein JST93_30850 [Acidobacteria bacterium]|nr:hypothetical protein [Acidobacteriota bacterium]